MVTNARSRSERNRVDMPWWLLDGSGSLAAVAVTERPAVRVGADHNGSALAQALPYLFPMRYFAACDVDARMTRSVESSRCDRNLGSFSSARAISSSRLTAMAPSSAVGCRTVVNGGLAH